MTIDDDFKKLAKEIATGWEIMYNICYPEVERIINNKIRDISVIEHTLDQVMDIYTEKGFYLFLKLLLYYRTINEENAKDYLEILKQYRAEEYVDFVKKYQKVR